MNTPQIEFTKPNGYQDYQDDSFSKEFYLASGSYNCLIDKSGRINSRKGKTLIGGNSNDNTTGITNAYTFTTSYQLLTSPVNVELALRSTKNNIQVYLNDEWKDLYTSLKGETPKFTSWYDINTHKSVLLFVKNDKYIYKWGAGVAEIGSMTSNSITLKYNKRSSVTNIMTFSSVDNSISQIDTDFIIKGFKIGDFVRIAGTTNNDGTYEIASVSANKIIFTDNMVNETINTTNCLISVSGKWSWESIGFDVSGNLVKNGTTLVYTGGNTETITITNAIDPNTIYSVGETVFSEITRSQPSGGGVIVDMPLNIISSTLNQIYTGNTSGRVLLISQDSNYADFSYNSTIRIAGDGGVVYLDDNLKSITHQDELTFIGAGKSFTYKIWFEPFSEGTTSGELIRVKLLRSGYGTAPLENGFISVENGIMAIRNDKVIGQFADMQNITQATSLPLSYKISRLLDKLDFSSISGAYLQNKLFILFAKSSTLIIYDFELGFWQPPQIISGSVLSVYNGQILLHSNNSDQTFIVFKGLSDNGNIITSSVLTNSFMVGNRSEKKKYDEIFIETYINASTKLNWGVLAGYKGSDGVKMFDVIYDEDSNYYSVIPEYTSIGNIPLGYTTIGNFYPDLDIDDEIGNLRRIYLIQSTTQVSNSDQFQIKISSEELGAYYSLSCLGIGLTSCPEIKAEYTR